MKYHKIVMSKGKDIIVSDDTKKAIVQNNAQFIETNDYAGNEVVINKAHIVQIITDEGNSKAIQLEVDKKKRLKLLKP